MAAAKSALQRENRAAKPNSLDAPFMPNTDVNSSNTGSGGPESSASIMPRTSIMLGMLSKRKCGSKGPIQSKDLLIVLFLCCATVCRASFSCPAQKNSESTEYMKFDPLTFNNLE